jgi:hypothetical protein
MTPPTPAELDRYRVELSSMMPENPVVRRQTAPSGAEGVELGGYDHVLVARRAANGKTEQACVGSVAGAMKFLSGSVRKGETGSP